MNTFRLQLRFLVPLALTLALAAYLSLPLMDRLTLRWFSRDLNLRGALVTNAMSDSVSEALKSHAYGRLITLFERSVKDERLLALGICGPDGKMLPAAGPFGRAPEQLSGPVNWEWLAFKFLG